MRVFCARKQLSGSNVLEPLGEGPRAAGIDPAKERARDTLAMVYQRLIRAGLFEALGEGPRVAGIDPARKAARDALTVAIRHAFRADPFELRNPCQMSL
ncbi:MAG: hypothetical protein BGP19_08695 [Thiobacillus sp. 0-1251]|nr:MAG: hypothetical protein BGP19_08695 [Thiobacillus sp. 0-1251]